MKQIDTLIATIKSTIVTVTLVATCFISCNPEDSPISENSLFDYDGNEYPVTTIGDQCWMAQNLKVTHYEDGTPITPGIDTLDIYQQDSLMYYFNYPTDSLYFDDYGHYYPTLIESSKMYTWAAATRLESDGSLDAKIQGVCPDGWRLPNKNDWDQLFTFVGDSIAGKVLKTSEQMIWRYENEEFFGTDDYGFNAIPSGGKSSMGSYYIFNLSAYFWSASTQIEEWRVWTPYIVHWNNEVQWLGYAKPNAFCVRCIQDK